MNEIPCSPTIYYFGDKMTILSSRVPIWVYIYCDVVDVVDCLYMEMRGSISHLNCTHTKPAVIIWMVSHVGHCKYLCRERELPVTFAIVASTHSRKQLSFTYAMSD